MKRVEVQGIYVAGMSIVAIETGEGGPVAVTADGERLSLDVDVLTAMSGDADLAIQDEGQTARIAASVAKLPLYWREKDGELTAVTVGGDEISQSAEPILAALAGANGTRTPLDYLNMQTSVAASNALSIGDLAGSLGKGVAGAIGGQIGSMIIDMIFPPKPMQSYFDELYERIAKLVKEEIAGNEIDKINGTLDGTQGYIRNMYLPRKKADAEKDELHSMIRPYVDGLYQNVTYTLLQDRFRRSGFSVFLIGASTHLSLIQEMALVDSKAKHPRDSSYAETVKKQMEEYADAAQKTWEEIKNNREGQFEVKDMYAQIPHSRSRVFVKGWIVDNETGRTVWETDSLVYWVFNRKKLEAAQKAAIDELSKQLAGDDGVDALLANWRAAYNALPEK